MTKAKKTTKASKKSVAAKTATDLEVKVKTSEPADKELVMEAKIEPAEKKPETKKESFVSSECVLTNTSQNTICLFNGEKETSISLQPREIKSVSRELVRELLKNKMVRRFFDKGIVTSNIDASEVSAHDAVIPQELKNPVERHEDGNNVVAQVKRFEREGSVKIDLG